MAELKEKPFVAKAKAWLNALNEGKDFETVEGLFTSKKVHFESTGTIAKTVSHYHDEVLVSH